MRRRDDTLSRRKDAYYVTVPGETRTKGKGYSDATVALVVAQSRMEGLRDAPTPPPELHVVRESLFGPTVLLSRVVRDEDGAVLTYAVNKED